MMPPTRLEQLGNFQDSIQSPEGLERLRALQYIQSALPSSQGLMGMPQVSAPVVARQYGGEVGTGGLVEVLDDGTQVFSNTEEGILNRSLHGGLLEGYNQQTGTTGTTASGTDAAGTAASGTSAPSPFTIQTEQDKYGNVIGDLTGTQDYYDLNFAARDAGQDTFMYGDKLMQVDPGYLRGGRIDDKFFISNRLPAGLQQEVSENPDAFENPYNLNTIRRKNISGVYNEPAYVPLEDFSRDVSGQYDSYYAANQAAKAAGSPTFMWGDKWAKTDPGLLPDYTGAPKPFISNEVPEELRHLAGGPLSVHNLSAQQIAEAAPGYVNPEWSYYERIMRGLPGKTGGQISSLKGGGQISDTAQGLASFGRYGDNILVHMNPEELSGLASLGQITYNPVTGLPEAFSLKGIFKAVRKIAPIALAVAAPYALGGGAGLGLFAGTPGAGMSALSFGLATGIGSLAGNLIAGAKPKDALKSAILSGAIGGVGQGISTGNWAGSAAAKAAPVTTPISTGTDLVSKSVTSAPGGVAPQFGTMTPSNVASGSARIGLGGTVSRPPLQLAQASVPISPGSPTGYTGQLQPTVATDMPSNLGSKIQFEGGGSAFVDPSSTGQMATQSSGNIIERVSNSPLVTDTSKAVGDLWGNIKQDYGTWKGAAKLVGMDLMQTDWEQQYANEAKAKEQALRDAGYTVDTGFDGQTVIRDSQGVIMPRNLTPSMILDRALGRSPRQRMIARYGYGQAKHGGLVSLAHGGEFSGKVPGDGHGMEDNVYMPIKEGSEQVGTLAVSPSEYVVDSYTMAALGNGNTDEGAKVMDKVVKHVRKKAYGTTKQPNEISGLKTLEPMMERARQ